MFEITKVSCIRHLKKAYPQLLQVSKPDGAVAIIDIPVMPVKTEVETFNLCLLNRHVHIKYEVESMNWAKNYKLKNGDLKKRRRYLSLPEPIK